MGNTNMMLINQQNPLMRFIRGKALHRTKKLPAAQAGYGLMMLILFITSTVLMGVSMQIMLGAGTASYLGTMSQDNVSAKELAQSGMETILADIQSRMNSNTAVTSAYTYSSANITMPNDPANLGGGSSTIGSFSATMTAARGNSYLVNIVATVNNSVYSYSKLLNMGRTTNTTIDTLPGGNANAIYALRKLRSAYAGSAIRIRRSSDNTEQDIGFDGNGDLDMTSLKSFLSTSTYPVDSVTGATVAYGMRRLTKSYTGAAINVRRSSDNATQDIGFTSAGDLDVASLINFVGNNNGYVTIWYDQSGNGYNATQGTTGNQPTIVTSGVLNLVNNRPSITFDGSNDSLVLSQAVYDDMTIMAVYNAISCPGNPGSLATQECRIINSDQGGVANDFTVGIDNAGNANAVVGNPDTINGSYAKGIAAPGDGRLHWVGFTRLKSTGYYNVYNDAGFYSDGNGNTSSLNALNNIYLSWQANLGMSEVIMYNSVLSETNRLTLERNEAWYYNLYPYWIGWTLPLNSVGSSTAAYGLRKLRTTYGGYAINVRRSSDNATQDIGFDTTTSLDVVSLLTFVGTGSGYVTKWYDQSGNGLDASQGTAGNQPRIVNAGVLETQAGRPTVRFISANSTNLNFTEQSGITNYSAYIVAQMTGTTTDNFLLSGISQNRQLLRIVGNPGVLAYFAGTTTPSTVNTISNTTTQLNSYAIVRSGGIGTGYVNGATYTMGSSDGGSMYVGRIGCLGGSCADAYISELILYPSALTSANQMIIHQNQLFYFNPPAPAAYVTKWYDQSGNGNDLSNTNPLTQPQLLMHPYAANSGRPTVLFDGAQYLYSTTGMPTSADYSKVAVFSYFGVGTNNTSYGTNNIISSDAANLHALYMSSSQNIRLFHGGDFATASSASGFNMLPNINYSSTGTFAQSSKTGTVYVFNQSAGTGTTSTSNTDAGLQLGAHQGLSNTLYGTISEAMIFARNLSTTDRTTLYNDERAYFGTQ